MRAAAGGLAFLVALTAVIHRPSHALQATAGYAPYSDITGRVWVEGEESGKLHAAGGGGVWLSFLRGAEYGEPGDRLRRGGDPMVPPYGNDLLIV